MQHNIRKMRDSHNSDMDRLRHEKSQRQKALARKEKAAARAAKAPPKSARLICTCLELNICERRQKWLKGRASYLRNLSLLPGRWRS